MVKWAIDMNVIPYDNDKHNERRLSKNFVYNRVRLHVIEVEPDFHQLSITNASDVGSRWHNIDNDYIKVEIIKWYKTADKKYRDIIVESLDGIIYESTLVQDPHRLTPVLKIAVIIYLKPELETFWNISNT